MRSVLTAMVMLCSYTAMAQDTLERVTLEDPEYVHRIDSFELEIDTTPPPKKVFPKSGAIQEHDYVDLGLSVKWATCNVGAEDPTDYGEYYAWGETPTKTSYVEGNCAMWDKKVGDITGNGSRDAAKANWGGSWRLPTRDEMEELLTECTHRWCQEDGHNGYLLTGPNGKTMFLPAAGRRYGSQVGLAMEVGMYMSSTPCEGDDERCWGLGLNGGDIFLNWYYRYFGFTVRPVSK